MNAPDQRTVRPVGAGLLAGAIFAVLFGCAWPPADLWPLVLIAIAPLCMLAWRTHAPVRAGLGVWIAAAVLFTLLHTWLWRVTALGTPALGMILAIYPAAFVLILAKTRRLPGPRWVWAAVIWTGLEFLRGEIVGHGYPWFLIGHPTIESATARIAASWVGVYGVSLGVALIATAAASMRMTPRRDRRVAPLVVSLTLFVALAAGLLIPRQGHAPEQGLRIAVVQSNVPSDNKTNWTYEQREADFTAITRLTRLAAAGDPDLVVWPETMFPGLTLSPEGPGAAKALKGAAPHAFQRVTSGFYDDLLRLQSEIDVPMLVGAIAEEGFRFEDRDGRLRPNSDASYNSVFHLEAGAVAEVRYDKIHLTPFGEVMPYISAWPWLERQLLALGAAGMTFDLEAGTERTRFEIDASGSNWRVATPICFEATMSAVCRSLVFEHGERRADLLINVTNDGWFGASVAGRRHHLMLARWRAAELGTPVVRAANTGISAAIDARGRVTEYGPNDRSTEQAAAREEGVMTVVVAAPGERPTLFGRTGNVIGVLATLLTAMAIVASAVQRRGTRDSQETSE